jgi:hypothetical protein
MFLRKISFFVLSVFVLGCGPKASLAEQEQWMTEHASKAELEQWRDEQGLAAQTAAPAPSATTTVASVGGAQMMIVGGPEEQEQAIQALDASPAEKAQWRAAFGLPPQSATPAPSTPTPVATSHPQATRPPTASASKSTTKASWPDLAASMEKIGGGQDDAAIIVGVEDYAFVADVPGATKNAKDWYRYFTRVRGTSPGNVKLLLGNQATDVGMKSAMKEAAGLVRKGGTLWFVFIGHGAPSEDQKDGLLVGVDAQQSARGLYGRSVAQRELIVLAALGKQQRTVFFVDACFSGRTGSGQALAAGLQPLLPVKQVVGDKRTLIFSAAASDQFAGPLPMLDRPAFSYLMLGGMLGWSDANGDGEVSSKELTRYSQDTLRAVLNDRNQTPAMYPDREEKLSKSAGFAGPDVSAIVLGE